MKLLWIPAHPSEQSVSMNRYRDSLADRARTDARLDSPPVMACGTDEAGAAPFLPHRLVRAWHRYREYPARVRSLCREETFEVAHLLDHSSAHLIPRVVAERIPVVATVHDLIPLIDQNSGLSHRQTERFRRCVENLRHADHLAVVSRVTRASMIELLGIPEERITVVPMGVSPWWEQPAERGDLPSALRKASERPYVFSISSTLPRKNLAILPDVLKQVREAVPELALIRAGARLEPSLAQACREAVGGEGFFELGPIDDRVLRALYQRAAVFFFPSRHEGFGLPVAEAMRAGCPVACSGSDSLPEVGGEAALYFPPEDPAAAAAAIVSLLQDSALRQSCVAAGRRRAAELTWEAHWNAMMRIYQSLAGPGVRAKVA